MQSLIKLIKSDTNRHSLIKKTLGKWKVLQNQLVPLLQFHTQDKRLAFQTLMLCVQLTELPHRDCEPGAREDIF